MTPEDEAIRGAVVNKALDDGESRLSALTQALVIHPFDSDQDPPKRKVEKAVRQVSAEASQRLREARGEEAMEICRAALQSYLDVAKDAKDTFHAARFGYIIGRFDGATDRKST